jgi:hypothetical protein
MKRSLTVYGSYLDFYSPLKNSEPIRSIIQKPATSHGYQGRENEQRDFEETRDRWNVKKYCFSVD